MGHSFLKWAGGKRWFVNHQSSRFPAEYDRYIEPFLGGGSVFFRLEPREAILNDINKELIDTYCAVRDEAEAVCHSLKIHANNHCKDYYYKVRGQKLRTAHTRAARMIYLNKACFNGIYRVNKQGGFNVPYGMKDKLYFDEEDIISASRCLKNAQILHQDFEEIIDMARVSDFVFCDPPYAVLNDDNRFVGYNPDVFSWDDQIRLVNVLKRAKNRGVKIVMTNVADIQVRQLYKNIDGFFVDDVQRQCFISGNLEGRKIYSELVVSANI